jgi:hypothetical protein
LLPLSSGLSLAKGVGASGVGYLRRMLEIELFRSA